MKYRNWLYREGLLVVEKFTGKFNFDQIRTIDILTENLDSDQSQQLLVLTDLSDALFPEVEASQIEKVFGTIDKNISAIKGMKMAILANSDIYDEFIKANNFAIEATKRPITVMVFHTYQSAMNWLEVDENEQSNILKKISEIQ